MNLVFVYGSLKKGFSNHRLLSTSEFVSKGTVHDAELYSLGGFPALVSGGGSVEGELYEVSPETLRNLDMLEGHPNFYRRETRLVDCSMNGQLPCHVYIYQGEVSGDYHIPCGEWKHEHVHAPPNALRGESQEAV